TEQTIRRLAAELGEDVDVLLAAAGQISSDIREIIVQRPLLFTELIRGLNDLTDQDLAVLVERVRNGNR
ncbi:MAG TPA: XRE family transcriptional regulator, partial [Candidatus Competibacter sp.]|nr:XRE family transcriptional regulator [Candidatus Competibacter sp.]